MALQARVIAVRSAASSSLGNNDADRSRSSRGGSVSDERREQAVGQLKVSVALVFLERPAHPDRTPVLVEVADLGRLKLADARAALVDDEQRQHVVPWQHIGDALDMFGKRWRDMRLAFLRQLDTLVARRVRVDLVVVERLRECVLGFLNRLALGCGRAPGSRWAVQGSNLRPWD